jgi:hypothetical protein
MSGRSPRSAGCASSGDRGSALHTSSYSFIATSRASRDSLSFSTSRPPRTRYIGCPVDRRPGRSDGRAGSATWGRPPRSWSTTCHSQRCELAVLVHDRHDPFPRSPGRTHHAVPVLEVVDVLREVPTRPSPRRRLVTFST